MTASKPDLFNSRQTLSSALMVMVPTMGLTRRYFVFFIRAGMNWWICPFRVVSKKTKKRGSSRSWL